MKRLIMLAVLCAFVLSAAAAQAADIKASGAFVADAVWQKNWDFVDGNGDNSSTRTFGVNERADITFEFIASENLKAVFNVRSQAYWGETAFGVGDAETGAIMLRKAYIDFMWPDTEIGVKAGFQSVALPGAVGGSHILDDRIAGALVSYADMVTVGYMRAEEAGNQTYLDFYTVIGNFNAGGATLNPFFVLANAGDNVTNAEVTTGMQNAGNTTSSKIDGAYWLGIAATMPVGDFTLAGDFDYGNVSAKNNTNDRSGWLLALSAEYAGMDGMTPEAFFVYTTGEDDKASNGSERMPTISPDWAVGSFWFGGDTFLKGSISNDDTQIGFWTLGASLKDIASFADGLTHTVHALYVKGTNDKDATGLTYGESLTEKDSLIELDFNTYYKLYDELTVGVELGYLNLDAKKDVWGSDGGSAYKLSTGIAYKF